MPLVILWTWKTLGLLAPLLILLMPMFLLSTALDRFAAPLWSWAHCRIMALAPLLLAGLWALRTVCKLLGADWLGPARLEVPNSTVQPPKNLLVTWQMV